MAHYELTATTHKEGTRELFQIRATQDFVVQGKQIKTGDLGGFVENEKNISTNDGETSWVMPDGAVYNEAEVKDGSLIEGKVQKALVSGNVFIDKNSKVNAKALITDGSQILSSEVKGYGRIKASVIKSSKINGKAFRLVDSTLNRSTIEEAASAEGSQIEKSTLKGDVKIFDNSLIEDSTLEGYCEIFDSSEITKSSIEGYTTVSNSNLRGCKLSGKNIVLNSTLVKQTLKAVSIVDANNETSVELDPFMNEGLREREAKGRAR